MAEAADIDSAQDWRRLYDEAFARFHLEALWSFRPIEDPSVADALAVSRSLRYEGGMAARRLAERIERACSAR